MKINNSFLNGLNPISFGYSSPLKTLRKEGKLPTVEVGMYGGKLTKENICLEHIQPHSKGGKTRLSNLALTTMENNNNRGNDLLSLFFDKEKFEAYLEQFKGLVVPYMKKNKEKVFDGDQYISLVKGTVNQILENEKKLNILG